MMSQRFQNNDVAHAGGASLPSKVGRDSTKQRVSYFYEMTIGDYYYGQSHPMEPHRIRMAHNLVVHYRLYRLMEIFCPFSATSDDICLFHSDDYVDFLASVTPEFAAATSGIIATRELSMSSRQLKRFNVCEDCPLFDGLFEFCRASAGGSIGVAIEINKGDADITINWVGGLHHAKKSEASGLCYVNDIVLGIFELLKVHRRVLYVDIDIHHGDGVEEAFFATNRVMTVSFHKYGDFIPGTKHIKDVGYGIGKYYALNIPLNDGKDDESFHGLFRPIVQKVMEIYQPEAFVLQCGADSLSGDRLGCFNLSVKGHANCLRFIRSFDVPLMILGGGDYTIRNVARCWCYETAIALGVEPDNKLLVLDESDEMLSKGFKDQIHDVYRYPPPELQPLQVVGGGAYLRTEVCVRGCLLRLKNHEAMEDHQWIVLEVQWLKKIGPMVLQHIGQAVYQLQLPDGVSQLKPCHGEVPAIPAELPD